MTNVHANHTFKNYGEYTECNEANRKSTFEGRFLEMILHVPMGFEDAYLHNGSAYRRETKGKMERW